MRNFLRKAIPFIVIGLFLLMATILPELLGGDIKTWCETNLGPYWWALLILIFLLLFGLAAKYNPGILGGLLPSNNNDKSTPKPEDITRFYPEINAYLKTRYGNRLKQKLANRQPVNLRRLPSTYGTSEETSVIFIKYDSDEIREELAQIFRDAHGRLLLIGAPGAGKTTLLLQLVLNLLGTEPYALPALLNLATWTKEYADLDAWLREILPAELGVNKALAAQILQDNRLILLFDGLDEVKEENRPSCLEAIGRYGMDAQRRFVISSRMEEYKQVKNDAPVNLQIEVGPLTLEQIKAELQRMGNSQPEALRLLVALEKDKLLQETVQTPFYFNTLQLLFASGKKWSDLRFTAETLEGRQAEMVERFVREALLVPSKDAKTPEQTRQWLAFWASRMEQENLMVFELVNLQYDWWKWSRIQVFFIELRIELALWLLFGLGIGLLFSKLIVGLLVGLGIALLRVLVGTFEARPEIYTKDETRWSLKNFLTEFKEGWKIILGSVLVIGLLIGLDGRILTGLLYGLVFGIGLGLLGGVAGMIENHFSNTLQITTPYQRFIASMKFLHFPIFQHLHLRWMLYRQGLLPLRLVTFLNEMTERHILESDGATWRFRHRILQEYFAGQWVEPEEDKK